MLDSSFQGVKRLSVLAYNNRDKNRGVKVDSYQNHFLPTLDIKSYNIEIDVRNFNDKPVNDPINNMVKLERMQKDKEMFIRL